MREVEGVARSVSAEPERAPRLHHSVDALVGFAGLLLWVALIAPFARPVWRRLRGRPLPTRRS
ncbi:MAG TPA: hypothetical protein VJV76_06740 [Gaiellaceae bacterium]|nr:hypothetical protein [Gaiellaceae bacterium]